MGELGTLTALTCMYEKSSEVAEAVLEALAREGPDETVLVLDRPSQGFLQALGEMRMPEAVSDQAKAKPQLVQLRGLPGWRSPCVSWNAGLKQVTGDSLLIIQGDIVLNPGALQAARTLLQEKPAVYFGQVLESKPMKGPGHAGHVLCSAANPRPLTYLLALPTSPVKAIEGWDEAFQAGVWYEDNDFTARLWKHGLDFVFDDRLSGIHQSHERTYSDSYKIGINRGIFTQKHGTDDFFNKELRNYRIIVDKQPGRTTWRHIGRTDA